MSSFQICGLYLVSMLLFSLYLARAQDRNIYKINGAQLLNPIHQLPPNAPLTAYNVNGAAIASHLVAENGIETIKPYEFGFQTNDGNGTFQHRQEIRLENGDIQGSYGYLDADGVYREVEYYTDANGYHANVKSNEPGLSNKNSANVVFVVENPPRAAAFSQQRPWILVPKSQV